MKRPASLQQSGAHGAEDTKAGPQGPNWHTDYDRTLGLMWHILEPRTESFQTLEQSEK